LAVPIVFVGLIDPLEGGIALILAGFVYLVAFLVGGRKPTKFLWISYLSAIVIGAIVAALNTAILSFRKRESK